MRFRNVLAGASAAGALFCGYKMASYETPVPLTLNVSPNESQGWPADHEGDNSLERTVKGIARIALYEEPIEGVVPGKSDYAVAMIELGGMSLILYKGNPRRPGIGLRDSDISTTGIDYGGLFGGFFGSSDGAGNTDSAGSDWTGSDPGFDAGGF